MDFFRVFIFLPTRKKIFLILMQIFLKKRKTLRIGISSTQQIFITGHSEYDRDTLANEYFRDVNAGKPIEIPKNYFPNDNPKKNPVITWRAHANLLYSNWLNYFVYQTTPYDIEKIN